MSIELPNPAEGKRVYELDRAHVFHSWSAQGAIAPFTVAKTEGSYLWDYDGKRTDGFVVEKLLATEGAFFRDTPLGEAVALTIRVPNPALERSDAKLLLEVLRELRCT